jgi:hypothetical protein
MRDNLRELRQKRIVAGSRVSINCGSILGLCSLSLLPLSLPLFFFALALTLAHPHTLYSLPLLSLSLRSTIAGLFRPRTSFKNENISLVFFVLDIYRIYTGGVQLACVHMFVKEIDGEREGSG